MLPDPVGWMDDLDNLEMKYLDLNEGAQPHNLLMEEARVAKKYAYYKISKLEADAEEGMTTSQWTPLRDKLKKSLDCSWTKKEYQTVVDKANLFQAIYRRKTQSRDLQDLIMTEEEQKEEDHRKALAEAQGIYFEKVNKVKQVENGEVILSSQEMAIMSSIANRLLKESRETQVELLIRLEDRVFYKEEPSITTPNWKTPQY